MTNLLLHGQQVHPAKTLAGCAAQDAVVGVPAAICGTFWPMQQSSRYLDFPIALADGLWQRKQLHLMTWSAMDLTVGKGWPVADVLMGKHDAYLHKQARLLAAWKHPTFVRLDHEFSWPRSPFYQPGADFVALWRYIVDLFRADGATNVTWIWCPNQISPGEDLAAWYPGGAYVDWTSVDGYNWGLGPSGAGAWQSFASVFDTSIQALLKIDPSKPIFLAEWAADDRGGDKAAWLRDALAVLPVRYPAVGAFCYYPTTLPSGEHWALSTTDGTAQAYVAALKAGPYAQVGAYPMPEDLKPIQPLQAASWGDPTVPLQAQVSAGQQFLADAKAALATATADAATARANTDAATAAGASSTAAVQGELDQAKADVAKVVKLGTPAAPTDPVP